VQLTFLGAAGTVTGSKYLVEVDEGRLLVDCGLFQGEKSWRLRNWEPLPVSPREIAAVVITHAHLDHSGYLPLLVRSGFSGPVYCSPGTRDLCAILLPDAGRLQEEEAAYANRKGHSKHHPALPLYTEQEAYLALQRLSPVPFGKKMEPLPGLACTLVPAGHLLGAAMVVLGGPAGTLTFTGDLGRANDPLMPAPSALEKTDYLVMESTYGNREHAKEDPEARIGEIVRRTISRGGVVVVPAFSVGRAQQVLHHLARLFARGEIPQVPVFLNSPMAEQATAALCRHVGSLRISEAECRALSSVARPIADPEGSKRLNGLKAPMIIIAGSGMATGGRVLHHIKAFAPDPRNTFLFTGFQAAGTRGAAMVAGSQTVKVHGEYIDIRASVVQLDGLSAHADAPQLLAWLSAMGTPPRRTFITHGELSAAQALKERIQRQLGWTASIPGYLERVELGR
jgi:metallo-beta-lactamase family protein